MGGSPESLGGEMQPTVEVLRDKLESLNPLSERMPSSDRLSYLLNALEPLSPSERISFVLQELPGKAMATTSGGIQSALLPSFFQKVRETQPETAAKIDSLPIVLIDTGDLFQESIDYVSRMKRDLGLNFLRIKHDLGKGEFKLLHSALTDRGMSPFPAPRSRIRITSGDTFCSNRCFANSSVITLGEVQPSLS